MYSGQQPQKISAKKLLLEKVVPNSLGTLDTDSEDGQDFWRGYLIAIKIILALAISVAVFAWVGGWIKL